jgi:hypothetical protein
MPQRVIKMILPENMGKQALEMLEGQENLSFWLEESSGGIFVASALTDSGRSEEILANKILAEKSIKKGKEEFHGKTCFR